MGRPVKFTLGPAEGGTRVPGDDDREFVDQIDRNAL